LFQAEKKPPHKEMILTDEQISTKIYSIEKIVPAHPCALSGGVFVLSTVLTVLF
jgi:hypothetical protein